jgi:hypothetical protein
MRERVLVTMANSWRLFLFTLLALTETALANVEKVIFLGPSALQIPQSQPTLEDLRLRVLTPHQSTLRTELRKEFPSESSEKGVASWFLLDELVEGQRYEVRICWAATVSTLSNPLNAVIILNLLAATDLILALDPRTS